MQPQQTTQEQKRPNRMRLFLSIAFLLALMFLTFYLIFRDNTLDEVLAIIRTVNPLYLAVAFVLALGFLFFQAAVLRAPMRALGIKPRWGDYISNAFVGFYFSAITPSASGGQPMQLYYMIRRGVPVAETTLTLLLANIAYQIVVMLYGLVMLIVRFTFVSRAVTAMTALIVYGYVITSLVLVALCFAMFSKKISAKVVAWVIRVLAKLRIVKDKEKALDSAERTLQNYGKGATTIRQHPIIFVKVVLLTIAQMTCHFLVPFFIYKALGLSGANVVDLVAVQAILYIAVSYLPLPGAIGATEKGFVSMFSIFFTSETIVPAMLLSRGITFYFLLVVSAVATLWEQARKPKMQTQIAVAEAEQQTQKQKNGA